ncbi:MAG TPA: hypothetical protein VJ866_04405 [Pyrinomonadaceae bacterium]|nr:hypothetical protein [Pyrinomonadaceae bacterium]
MREENKVPAASRVDTAQQPARDARGKAGLRGCWELLIKLIILLILILILLAYWWGVGPFGPRGDFGRGDYGIWMWVWLLLLIALLIWLIWRQKHFVMLRCDLTGPTGCTYGQDVGGQWLEPIPGTAAGLGFSHYELSLYYDGSPVAGGVIYADGGGNPAPALAHGNHQVNAGTLGFVDLIAAFNGAGAGIRTSTDFEVRLRVVGIDQSTCNHTVHFQLNVALASIKKVGAAWSHDYANPSETLCRIPPPGTPMPGSHAVNPASIGGSVTVRGDADVHGCADEKLAEVHVWAIPDDTFSFPQPAPGSPIVAPAASTFHSEVIFTTDDQRDANPLYLPGYEGAVLTYVPGWFTRQDCYWVHLGPPPTPPVYLCTPPVPALHTTGWPTGATGKYTLLLAVKDTAGNTYFDVQRVWVDNDLCLGKITSVGGLTGCLDLRLSQFVNTTCEIRGFAWDRAIRAADPQVSPNDNFAGYSLSFQKNGGGGGPIPAATPGVRVPAVWSEVPPGADGVLANWDIIADIDNGAAAPPAGSPKLQRGSRCAYVISLSVSDTTLVNDGGGGGHAPIPHPLFAFNIINDL